MDEDKDLNEKNDIHHGLKFQDDNQEKKIVIFLDLFIKKKKKTI